MKKRRNRFSSDDFRILSGDPFKASEYMASKYGSKVKGTEKINGINCEKQVVTGQDTKIHSRWFSEVVNFYKQAMTAKGRQVGTIMSHGILGMLQLSKGKTGSR